MGFNNEIDLAVYGAFEPLCGYFCCENPVFFSKRYANVIYYIDKISEIAV